jgi:hypothetical protein
MTRHVLDVDLIPGCIYIYIYIYIYTAVNSIVTVSRIFVKNELGI